LSIADLAQGVDIVDTKERITEAAVAECGGRLVAPGTLVMSFKLSVGKLGFVRVPLYTNEAIAALPIRNEKQLNPRFLYRALQVARLSEGADRAVKGLTLNSEKLARIPIAFPRDVDEQCSIADLLDKADAIRRKRNEVIVLHEELLRSRFLEMFGEPMTNPKKWPTKGLCDVCDPKQWPTIAASELSGSGYPVFGANGLIGYHAEMNHATPTVLITCRGATCGTINVSPANCYVTGNAMALDDPDPELIHREYLEWVLRIRGLGDTITGSAQPQITRQSLRAVQLPRPPSTLQIEFSKFHRSVTANLVKAKRAAEESERLLGALVSQVFSVDVSAADAAC